VRNQQAICWAPRDDPASARRRPAAETNFSDATDLTRRGQARPLPPIEPKGRGRPSFFIDPARCGGPSPRMQCPQLRKLYGGFGSKAPVQHLDQRTFTLLSVRPATNVPAGRLWRSRRGVSGTDLRLLQLEGVWKRCCWSACGGRWLGLTVLELRWREGDPGAESRGIETSDVRRPAVSSLSSSHSRHFSQGQGFQLHNRRIRARVPDAINNEKEQMQHRHIIASTDPPSLAPAARLAFGPLRIVASDQRRQSAAAEDEQVVACARYPVWPWS
jgi:hypothetical protein